MLISRLRDDLCLDFANTLYWRASGNPVEELHEHADLVGWIERATIEAAAADRDVKRPSADLDRKSELFVEAIAIREAIFRLFSAVATGRELPEADFAALGRALAEAPAREELARSGDLCGWNIDDPLLTMPQLLAPVLWSAGDLLVDGRRRRIRRCANEKYLWLFLDESKSGTRRWCQMSACGNRAKARRHYSKIKGR